MRQQAESRVWLREATRSGSPALCVAARNSPSAPCLPNKLKKKNPFFGLFEKHDIHQIFNCDANNFGRLRIPFEISAWGRSNFKIKQEIVGKK